MLLRQQLPHYIYLMRIHRPIGFLLLLWPTLWALWLASAGKPNLKILLIFVCGVFLMRSLGCVLNDYIDRDIDPEVERTKNRPLASGALKEKEALVLASVLALSAFVLVLQCNTLTIGLALVGAALAAFYPFLKRITHLPQLGLGIVFSWGIPMAFAAQDKPLTLSMWFLFFTSVLWPIIYDTIYAMVDREDDLKVGVKSTAILFNTLDTLVIFVLQTVFIVALLMIGWIFQLHFSYYLSVLVVTVLFVYQQWLIKDRQPQNCFNAFVNNNWVGLTLFCGIAASYLC